MVRKGRSKLKGVTELNYIADECRTVVVDHEYAWDEKGTVEDE